MRNRVKRYKLGNIDVSAIDSRMKSVVAQAVKTFAAVLLIAAVSIGLAGWYTMHHMSIRVSEDTAHVIVLGHVWDFDYTPCDDSPRGGARR